MALKETYSFMMAEKCLIHVELNLFITSLSGTENKVFFKALDQQLNMTSEPRPIQGAHAEFVWVRIELETLEMQSQHLTNEDAQTDGTKVQFMDND